MSWYFPFIQFGCSVVIGFYLVRFWENPELCMQEMAYQCLYWYSVGQIQYNKIFAVKYHTPTNAEVTRELTLYTLEPHQCHAVSIPNDRWNDTWSLHKNQVLVLTEGQLTRVWTFHNMPKEQELLQSLVPSKMQFLSAELCYTVSSSSFVICGQTTLDLATFCVVGNVLNAAWMRWFVAHVLELERVCTYTLTLVDNEVNVHTLGQDEHLLLE